MIILKNVNGFVSYQLLNLNIFWRERKSDNINGVRFCFFPVRGICKAWLHERSSSLTAQNVYVYILHCDNSYTLRIQLYSLQLIQERTLSLRRGSTSSIIIFYQIFILNIYNFQSSGEYYVNNVLYDFTSIINKFLNIWLFKYPFMWHDL